jgi:hypothetical protein
MNRARIAEVELQWEEADDGVFAPLLRGAAVGVSPVASRAIMRLRRAAVERDDAAVPLLFHADTQVYLEREAHAYFVESPDARLRVDREGNIDVAIEPTHDAVQFVAVALSLALALALRQVGLFHLHGALIDLAGRGVLLCAPGGGGKSTTLLSLVAAGGVPWCDDVVYCGVLDDRGPRATGLSRPLHVSAQTWRSFADLLDGAPPRATGREAMTLRRPYHAPSSPTAIDAVVAIEIFDADHTEFEAVSSAECLGVLLEASAWAALDEMPGAAAHLEVLGAVAAGATCVVARCGRDVLRSPVAFAASLADALRRER